MNAAKFLYTSCFLLSMVLTGVTVPRMIFAGENELRSPDFLAKVGRIQTSSKVRAGAGFVAGKGNAIFTVAHVVLKDTMRFWPYSSDTSYAIALKYVIKSLDLAVFSRINGEFSDGYEFGDFNLVRPGDSIVYWGWVSDRSIREGRTTVYSSGVTVKGGEQRTFIDFIGHGKDGYSGSPVFNMEGEVIAIITSVYDARNPDTKKVFRIVRAVSTDFVRILEKDFETSVEE